MGASPSWMRARRLCAPEVRTETSARNVPHPARSCVCSVRAAQQRRGMRASPRAVVASAEPNAVPIGASRRLAGKGRGQIAQSRQPREPRPQRPMAEQRRPGSCCRSERTAPSQGAKQGHQECAGVSSRARRREGVGQEPAKAHDGSQTLHSGGRRPGRRSRKTRRRPKRSAGVRSMSCAGNAGTARPHHRAPADGANCELAARVVASRSQAEDFNRKRRRGTRRTLPPPSKRNRLSSPP